MIICVQTRAGVIHYINWTTNRGTHYTMCGKGINGKYNPNTYGIDESIPDACMNCQLAFDAWGKLLFDDGIRSERGSMLSHNIGKYSDRKYFSAESKYDDLIESSYWDKKQRMQRKKKYNGGY